MKRLPDFLKEYFWEVDFDRLDPEDRPDYILERLLEYGDIPAVKWMFLEFPIEKITGTLARSRAISRKSANFWAGYFGLDRGKVRCLQKPSPSQPKAIWPY